MSISNKSRKVLEQPTELINVSPVKRSSKHVLAQTGDLEKKMIQKLCSYIQTGAFEVVFWDGTKERYGEGVPFFKLIISDKSVVIGKMVKNPALAFGEAYADGLIELDGNIDDVIKLLHLNKNLIEKFTIGKTGQKVVSMLRKPSIEKQKKDVRHHYDLGNDFFALWLDPTMSYSCAYFRTPEDTLEQAQLQKLDHTLKKLQLTPGQTLLDIGSGWGWLIIRAAQQYGVKSTGITVSKEQYEKTKERMRDLQLGHLVDVLLMDYRDLAARGDKFDRVVSVGMFEHVGRAGIPVYMSVIY